MEPSISKPSTSNTHPCGCSEKGRNLVVCIDGSANKFGAKNTNVVELYSHILRPGPPEAKQLTYYDSGIGTFAKPSWKSLSYLKTALGNKIDLAIAWNLEKVILGAYRWLSNNYEPGDKIYLFGFSRGAYQVRVLAAMIHTVGLILPGNEAQIPFAFELYSDYDPPEAKDPVHPLEAQTPNHDSPKAEVLDDLGKAESLDYDLAEAETPNTKRPEIETPDSKDLVGNFKKTFSRNDVKIHFVGVWDTVSSVGIRRGKKMLPHVVDSHDHICIFRHALALDEHRVKFTPEYIHEGASCTDNEDWNINHHIKNGVFHSISAFFKRPACTSQPVGSEHSKSCKSNIKEVWFAGSHSDIGGGNRENTNLESGDIPLLWMRNEAMLAGLRLTSDGHVEWSHGDLDRRPQKSLTSVWWLLECLPLRRLSYKSANATTRMPNRGRSRKIVPGQTIHVSVICKPNYRPSQTFPDEKGHSSCYKSISDEREHLSSWPLQLHHKTPEFHDRLTELGDIWDKDLFDYSALRPFQEGKAAQVIHCIAFISTFEYGRAAISAIEEAPAILKTLLKDTDRTVRMDAAITLCELGSISSVNAAKEFADGIIEAKCLNFIISQLSKSNTADSAKIRASNAIPSLIKNEYLRPELIQDRLPQALLELWNHANDKVSAASVWALSHLVEYEDARRLVDCKDVLVKLDKQKQDNAFSDPIRKSAATMLTHLARSDENRRVIVGTAGLNPILLQMINPTSKRTVSVQAAYLKMLLSLTREYPEDTKAISQSNLPDILISILTDSDPSLIPDAAAVLCNLLPGDDIMLLSFDILLNRIESKDKHTWTSSFHGLKLLVHHGPTSHVDHKPKLVGALVKKMAHGKSHSYAAHALSRLAHHHGDDPEMREAIIKSDFAAHLRHRFTKGGAESSRLLDALHSFTHHDKIRHHVIENVISPLIEHIRKGNIFSIKFAYDCVRPSLLQHGDLRHALLESGLVDALRQLVATADHFRLYPIIYILHALDAYVDTRAAILPPQSDIIQIFVRKSETHHVLQKCLSETHFSDSVRSAINGALKDAKLQTQDTGKK